MLSKYYNNFDTRAPYENNNTTIGNNLNINEYIYMYVPGPLID